MAAAVRGACAGSQECGLDTPAVLAVTVLTSMDDAALEQTGVRDLASIQVNRLATLAVEAGVQGVVCSPREASAMRDILGSERLIVTPGVRPEGAPLDDQARVASPRAAIDAGASHVVIGRPITAAELPIQAFENIATEG